MNTTFSPKLRRHLFFLLMFCFAAAILGDSTAESLLLARFGASFIPKMFMVNAAALFLLSAGMLSIVDKIDRRVFFSRALLVHGVILLLMRFAVAAHWDFLFLPLFSYAYGSKILFFLLFWTVANDLIDSRSAGRAFPAIAAGGTIGAIAVSFSISGLMRFFAVENLLFIWSGLVILSSFLLLPLRKDYLQCVKESKCSPKAANNTPSSIRFTQLLREEPLLKNMSILYALVFFLLLNQHYVFYRQIKEVFTSAQKIASFLGGFNGVSMLLTCILQVSVSGVILRKLGSTRSMLLLPIALLVVFTLQIIVNQTTHGAAPSLFLSIVAGMGVRIAFFDSFFSPNFQLFFSSLPKEIRGRGKLLIEGVVKPFSMVGAGTLLLWVAPALSLQMHLTIMALVAVLALFQTIRLKQAYTRTLTRYLTGLDTYRKDALLERFDFSGGEDFLSFFAKRLETEEFEVQKFLIDIIASARTEEAALLLTEYVDRADVRLRATIIAALGNFDAPLVAGTLTTFLYDNDYRVVANAVLSLESCKATDLSAVLTPLLNHKNQRVRSNSILALWPKASPIDRQHYLEQLKSMLYSNSTEDCAGALYVTGQISDEGSTLMLYQYCSMKAECGLQSGIIYKQAVIALGKKKSEEAFNLLLLIGQHSTPLQRLSVIDTIASLLPYCDETKWLPAMERGNTIYKNCILKAMQKARYQISRNCQTVLEHIAARESEAIEWEKQSVQLLAGAGSYRMALLACAVREEVVSLRLDNLLTISAHLDVTGVIKSVIPRLNHTDRHVRARAFEVFENTGDSKLNRFIIGCIEWADTLPRLPINGTTVESHKKERIAAGTYCTSHNRWVSICAEYACQE